MSATWEDLSGRVFNYQPATKDLQESTKAFRGSGAKIELQPILNYPASVALQAVGNGNIPGARQVIKAGDDNRTHYKSRLMSRAAANASRFL